MIDKERILKTLRDSLDKITTQELGDILKKSGIEYVCNVGERGKVTTIQDEETRDEIIIMELPMKISNVPVVNLKYKSKSYTYFGQLEDIVA